MNREEIKKAVADTVVDFARSEAEAAIKSIDLNDVQALVEAQMKNLTDPLEAEIQTTTSWWVKIRNRLYVTLMQQVVKTIVADIKQKIV
jgi:hypothetical protein